MQCRHGHSGQPDKCIPNGTYLLIAHEVCFGQGLDGVCAVGARVGGNVHSAKAPGPHNAPKLEVLQGAVWKECL